MRDYTKQDVVFLCDMPLVKEEASGIPFSEFSSMEAKTMLQEASMLARVHEVVPELESMEEQEAKQYIIKNKLSKQVIEGAKFLHSSNVSYINLFSKRYSKGDLDFIKTIINKRNIPEGATNYIQIEWLSDIYVRDDYYNEIQETIAQINKVEAKLIICAGKWSTFFFASYFDNPTKQVTTVGITRSTIKTPRNFGINNKLRGSMLTTHANCGLNKAVLIPVLAPAYYFQAKNKTPLIKADLLRCAKVANKLQIQTVDAVLDSKFEITLGTSLDIVTTYLTTLLKVLNTSKTKVSIDIETRFNQIDCIGIAYEETKGITIPFFKMITELAEVDIEAVAAKYGKEEKVLVKVGHPLIRYTSCWALEEEIAIHSMLNECFLHSNCLHVGQNYNYDSQFINKLWKLRVYSSFDTMFMHHSLFNSQDKDLATLASKYCDHYVYWKDDLAIQDNETRWKYNCKDVLYTLQIANKLEKILNSNETLLSFYKFQQYALNPCVVDMMNRGVLIDKELKEENLLLFKDLMTECLLKINYICNEEVNLNSTIQVKTLFKDILGIKPKYNRKSHTESFGADAMLQYLEEYPEYRTLLTLFLEYKSIKVFVTNFLMAKLDDDGKMRCDYNIAGTKTYRFASRKNVYGNACNMANIPSKGKIDLKVALQEYNANDDIELVSEFETDTGTTYSGILKLPNIKKMFIPEEGYMFHDVDYSAVDLNFVAWDSDCLYLMELISAGIDVYSILASEYYQRDITKKDEARQVFKSCCHAINYFGQPNTIAAKAGLSVQQVKVVKDWYLNRCPEVSRWHDRSARQVQTKGYVTNIFGARGYFYDLTIPTWLNQVVAWIGQSSTACLINRALVNLVEHESKLEDKLLVKLQTHDSLTCVAKISDINAADRLKSYMEIEIPYKDKLVIKAEVKSSKLSYGDCG